MEVLKGTVRSSRKSSPGTTWGVRRPPGPRLPPPPRPPPAPVRTRKAERDGNLQAYGKKRTKCFPTTSASGPFACTAAYFDDDTNAPPPPAWHSTSPHRSRYLKAPPRTLVSGTDLRRTSRKCRQYRSRPRIVPPPRSPDPPRPPPQSGRSCGKQGSVRGGNENGSRR
jgi:hypothetical protein